MGEEKLVTVGDFRKAARSILSKMAWDYYRSGSDAQQTLRRNLCAYRRAELWYRVLVDVSERDLRTTVLGQEIAFPIAVAPTAYHRLAHADGEVGTARAAAKLGTLFILSTLSTTTME